MHTSTQPSDGESTASGPIPTSQPEPTPVPAHTHTADVPSGPPPCPDNGPDNRADTPTVADSPAAEILKASASSVFSGVRLAQNNQQHVALVGFMGAGKSTVGSALAQMLNISFVDLDAQIVERTGKSIVQLFKDEGEVAFRAHERQALREALAAGQSSIIACGGGTFVDAAMRKMIQKNAVSCYLRAQAHTLFERLNQNNQRAARPLLAGPDPLATIKRLLGQRQEIYAQAQMIVDTDKRDTDVVVAAIISRLQHNQATQPNTQPAQSSQLSPQHKPSAPDKAVQMPDDTAAQRCVQARLSGPPDAPEVSVPASNGGYRVLLRSDSGPWLADAIIKACPRANNFTLVSDTCVGPLHAGCVAQHLRACGKHVMVHHVGEGESSKSLLTAAKLYDAMLNAGTMRSDALVAVGGGVVGDLGGFVASTLLRGIGFVQVPTTTLACVDASVGGKTAVNTSQGKNLVGTFYAPRAVLVCMEFLATQKRAAHAAGLVESIKMAASLDAEFFARLVQEAPALLEMQSQPLLQALAHSIWLKADVVAQDEQEAGLRAILNVGHTVGHAIETGENYQLPHGTSVALGMVAESAFTDAQGLTRNIQERLIQALQAFEQPVRWQDYSASLEALAQDKKMCSDGLRLPYIKDIGQPGFKTIQTQQLTDFIGKATV